MNPQIKRDIKELRRILAEWRAFKRMFNPLNWFRASTEGTGG